MITASRFHDFSSGHRVHGHESKCANLHGHNYRAHFVVEGEQDRLGRVIDFGVIKTCLCDWLETNWDHRFLIHERDPMAKALLAIDSTVVLLPFNPTAENMAKHLVLTVGPKALHNLNVRLVSCTIEETRKCFANFSLKPSYP